MALGLGGSIRGYVPRLTSISLMDVIVDAESLSRLSSGRSSVIFFPLAPKLPYRLDFGLMVGDALPHPPSWLLPHCHAISLEGPFPIAFSENRVGGGNGGGGGSLALGIGIAFREVCALYELDRFDMRGLSVGFKS